MDTLDARDSEQLKLLAIFHYVFAALAVFGLAFLVFHYMLMSSFMHDPRAWTGNPASGQPPRAFLDLFVWFYVFMGFFCVLGGALNLAVGRFLRQRRHRLFCQIVAGLNCLQMPFGTLLGVFTLVALGRDGVRAAFKD